MTDLIKAFGYLRVSGLSQVDGDGFPRQRETIEKFAGLHGMYIPDDGWFIEEGVSGANDLDDRPAFQRLLLALHSNGTRVVIVEKLDRLARKMTVQEAIIEDLQKHGFQLISTMEPDLCNDDPTRVLLRQFMGAIAEYDRKMIVVKLRAARQRTRKATGRCEGRIPFGMKLIVDGRKNRVVPDLDEQAVIQRMCEMHAAGSNYTDITNALNQEGLTTRGGSQWYVASVTRVLNRAG